MNFCAAFKRSKHVIIMACRWRYRTHAATLRDSKAATLDQSMEVRYAFEVGSPLARVAKRVAGGASCEWRDIVGRVLLEMLRVTSAENMIYGLTRK